MLDVSLYEFINKRSSVRSYQMNPVNDAILEKVKQFTTKVEPLFSNIEIDFYFFGEKEVRGLFAVKAPYYIAFYSETKDNYLLNTGYMMQQVDLFLSKNQIGSCWLGSTKPTARIPLQSNTKKEPIIMLAFGEPTEPIHRDDINQFKRKSLKEIHDTESYEHLLESVRLAPSAMNSQPWFFTSDKDQLIVWRNHPGVLREPVLGKLNTIDMGIALCHLNLAILNEGKRMSLSYEKQPSKKRKIYIGNISIE